MQVYCRIESGVESDRLIGMIEDFMESIRGLHSDDSQFIPVADLIAVGLAYDSIKAILTRLSRASFDYQAYLLSPEWKVRRDERINAAGRRCQVCNSPDRLNCHHRTYERIGRELPEDLFVLCEVCHGIFHRNGRLTRPPDSRISSRVQLVTENGKPVKR
jgi:hypothetical protein